MQYPDISYRTNGAGRQYHGLTASVKRNMAKGLQFPFAWTLQRDLYDLTATSGGPAARARNTGSAKGASASASSGSYPVD